MKKKILIAVCILLAAALGAVAVLNVSYRKITVVSGRDLVERCPRYARPGEEVTVTTAVVDDAEIYVNGADGGYVSPGIYVFTMPDADVQLRVNVIGYQFGS